MSQTITVAKFDNGLAEDIRTTNISQSASCLNFDSITYPNRIIPFPDSMAETLASGSTATYALADADICSLTGATPFVSVGYKDYAGGDYAAQWVKKSTVNGDWTKTSM